jgi:hypothetical protein
MPCRDARCDPQTRQGPRRDHHRRWARQMRDAQLGAKPSRSERLQGYARDRQRATLCSNCFAFKTLSICLVLLVRISNLSLSLSLSHGDILGVCFITFAVAASMLRFCSARMHRVSFAHCCSQNICSLQLESPQCLIVSLCSEYSMLFMHCRYPRTTSCECQL